MPRDMNMTCQLTTCTLLVRRGSNVRVKAHRLRAGGCRRQAEQRAGYRGQDERLTDVIQRVPFAFARAKDNPRQRCGSVLGRSVGWLGPCRLVRARQRRARSARAANSRWPLAASPPAAPHHTRIRGLNFYKPFGLKGTVRDSIAFVISDTPISRFYNEPITAEPSIYSRWSTTHFLRVTRHYRNHHFVIQITGYL